LPSPGSTRARASASQRGHMSVDEREARKSKMQTSNWIAAQEGGSREYIPVSSTPLDAAYQRSKSVTRSEYLGRLSEMQRSPAAAPPLAPAAGYISSRHAPPTGNWGHLGASIVFGSDPSAMDTSNKAYGVTSALPREEIDLLQTVPKLRDTTLDGSHRASMSEGHFLSIWDPYVSQHKNRSCSFQSALMLREGMHRHVRSQYHPDEKYVLPPTVQNDMGWGLDLDKYKSACAKYQEGAEWHGRAGSHITKFSERLLLGARHHQSGPMTNPKLHY